MEFQITSADMFGSSTFKYDLGQKYYAPQVQPTRVGFELMTSRSWQYISCHWDACSNHLAISAFNLTSLQFLLLFLFQSLSTKWSCHVGNEDEEITMIRYDYVISSLT